jgi:hypothetical protein
VYKKELIPGVMLYRNNIDHTFLMNSITSDVNIKKSYKQWGDHDNYLQAEISLEDINDLAGMTDAMQEISKHFKEVFFDYLEYAKTYEHLPKFLDYTGKSDRWVTTDGGLLQIHGKSKETEDQYGLGFHLDVHTIKKTPGWKNIFTTIIYLNDNYINGEIEFTFNETFNDKSFPSKRNLKFLKYKPKAGDIILFPAHFPHATLKPYGNDRHVFLSTCKYRTEDGDDMSGYLPETLDILLEIKENDNITYINGADI